MPIDYSRYPPNWLSEIRPRIMKRAGHCCEECKAPHMGLLIRPYKNHIWALAPAGWERGESVPYKNCEPVKIILCVLTIAHLDNDPENWEVKDERLKALCQRCHLKIDIKHHADNRKYGRDHRKNNYKLDL